MYPYKYSIPNNSRYMYRNNTTLQNYPYTNNYNNDERFFWAPFVVGGLAGTALGYGIANNNQLNNGNYNNNGVPCCGGYYYPMPYYPMYTNNYYN